MLKKYGSQLVGFPVDISRADECHALVQQTVKVLGGLDILVNNAAITGIPALQWFLDETTEHIDAVVDTNLKGTIYCSLAAARQMVSQKKEGVIIHISSVAAFAAQQASTIYCSTKAAISGLTQAMALELAKHQIRVMGIAPGEVRIEKSTAVDKQRQSIQADQQFVSKTPLRLGLPQDIGSVVAFLASKEAGFATGTTWIVDGGLLSY